MTDRDALLAAIHAAPEDDAPRLVFADWLDEHGEPERAEFIRIQVAMRREYDARGRTPHLEQLFVRSREVFYRPWAEHVRAAFGRGVGLYSRGFPRVPMSVCLPAIEAVARLPAVASWLWPDSTLTIRAARGRLGDVAGLGELRRVRHLSVASWRDEEPVTDADVADLVASPNVAGLKSLQLDGHDLRDAAVRAIAASPHLARLEVLSLNGNRIGQPGATALAAAPGLAGLRGLHLANNRLGNASVRALLESPYLAGLTSLTLNRNPYRGVRLAALVEARFPAPPPAEVRH